MILLSLFLIGFGVVNYLISVNNESSHTNSSEEDNKKEENLYEKLETETNEEALRRFCFAYTKKDECMTNSYESSENVYTITVPYDNDYNQSFTYDFLENKYSWGINLIPGASPKNGVSGK